MRLINADALEKALRDWVRDHWTEAFTGDDAGSEFADMIDHAETIDSAPVVHAHWDVIEEDSEGDETFLHVWETLRCSHCGMERATEDGYMPQYCEGCGAKMDEEGMNT